MKNNHVVSSARRIRAGPTSHCSVNIVGAAGDRKQELTKLKYNEIAIKLKYERWSRIKSGGNVKKVHL